MNYNQFSHPSIPPELNEITHPLCKRAKLDTGTFCNLNCTFCYYKDQLHTIENFETIKKRIDYLNTYSLIEEIELSGGESSIHPDWFKILEYANTKFSYISTVSHGQRFADEQFLIKSKKAGLQEILFSMHGTKFCHDRIVQKFGAWDKTFEAIHNSLFHKLTTRINCTVTTENINCLNEDFESILSIFIVLGLKQVNFIFHNYWEDNKNGIEINYKDLAQPVERIITSIKQRYPEFDIRLRYIPFCMISQEYHSLIYGQYQHIFDTTDWNKEIYSGVKYFNKDHKYSWKESLDLGWQVAKQNRLSNFFKPKECFKCIHFKWCDGLENQLKNHKVFPIHE